MTFYYGEAHGGVSVDAYHGGRSSLPEGLALAQTWAYESEIPQLDDKHCQRWKDEEETQQCGAFPVKDGPHAGKLCAGHINALEKSSRASEA